MEPKKKVLPSKNNVIVAKKDSSGNLITNKNSLLRLYRDEYIKRLTPKQPYSNLKEVQRLKNDLFEKRMEISKLSQSYPWKVSNIMKICKSLRNGKSRDENGLIYEIFKPNYAGHDLMNSLTIMFNHIKETFMIPDFMQLASITIN